MTRGPAVSTADQAPRVSDVPAHRIGVDAGPLRRQVVDEVPIEIVCNGASYAVMMVTPSDLDDFVTGFLLSEQLIASANDLRSIRLTETELGWLADVTIAALDPARGRSRQRTGDSGCGLCGISRLAQVAQPLNVIPKPMMKPVSASALFRSLASLADHQPLNRVCGGAHAAAAVSTSGEVMLAREDVGRHNAFDKLIGAAARNGFDLTRGYVLLSSRCSYELVEKAIVAGIPLLVTISTPTSLAVSRAVAHDLALVALARQDSMLVIHDPHGTIVLDATR